MLYALLILLLYGMLAYLTCKVWWSDETVGV